MNEHWRFFTLLVPLSFLVYSFFNSLKKYTWNIWLCHHLFLSILWPSRNGLHRGTNYIQLHTTWSATHCCSFIYTVAFFLICFHLSSSPFSLSLHIGPFIPTSVLSLSIHLFISPSLFSPSHCFFSSLTLPELFPFQSVVTCVHKSHCSFSKKYFAGSVLSPVSTFLSGDLISSVLIWSQSDVPAMGSTYSNIVTYSRFAQLHTQTGVWRTNSAV